MDMRTIVITKKSAITLKMLQLLQYFAIFLVAAARLLALICINSHTMHTPV